MFSQAYTSKHTSIVHQSEGGAGWGGETGYTTYMVAIGCEEA